MLKPRQHGDRPGAIVRGAITILWTAGLGAVAVGLALVAREVLFPAREHVAAPEPPHAAFFLAGRVVALDGHAVRGANVRAVYGHRRATTDARGRFRIPSRLPQDYVAVTHGRFLGRTQALAAGAPSVVRLTPDDGATISFHFGGDVMFGRRFYDPNEDGELDDGLLRPGAGVRAHAALLRGVAPLLRPPDISAVNLETPLSVHPYFNPFGLRPTGFHAAKDYVFASSTASPAALRAVGVDVVDLGNNHFYDRLEGGVRVTLAALRRHGFAPGLGAFGGGSRTEDAWRPAFLRRKGQVIAFVGCTTITSSPRFRLDLSSLSRAERHRLTKARRRSFLSYVASATKGGAARCTRSELRSHVVAARRRADLVVVMIHGGNEYVRSPSPLIRRLTDVAVRAGATLVINGHPHVAGGLAATRRSLVAWTMGNLLFDQTVWPTFQSYVLTVDVRRGGIVRAVADPIMIAGFEPRAVTGHQAVEVARGIAGRSAGGFVAAGPVAEFIPGRPARRVVETFELRRGVYELPPGAWIESTRRGSIRGGTDLLWTGGFEDEDVLPGNLRAPLWMIGPPIRLAGRPFAAHGRVGIRLHQRAGALADAVLSPEHRVLLRTPPPNRTLIVPGKEITVIGLTRRTAGAFPMLDLRWYAGTRGGSYAHGRHALGGRTSVWTRFRFDTSAPPRANAVTPSVRLPPPATGSASVDLDDVRLLSWARPHAFSPLFGYALVTKAATVRVVRDVLPGDTRPGSRSLKPRLVAD